MVTLEVPAAMDIAQDALDKGYEVTLNLMAVSTIQEWELDEALDIFAESGAQAIYLSDSFGTFYAEQVEYLMRKYLRLAVPRGKVVGMHAHNNQQLAFANTIEAIIQGGEEVLAEPLRRDALKDPVRYLDKYKHVNAK